MIRFGKVVAVDDKNAKVRVKIEDADAVVTYWLPVLHQRSQDDKHYWLPDVGELVVCAFYEDDWDTGVVLGAIYNEKDQTPAKTRDKFVMQFKDGTRIEYDRKAHKLHISVQGEILIEATGNVNITAESVEITLSNGVKINASTCDEQVSIHTLGGDLTVDGNLTVSGDINAIGNVQSGGVVCAQGGL